MTKAQLKLLSESQNCTIYSIQFAEDNAKEFDKFLQKNKITIEQLPASNITEQDFEM